MATLRQTGQEIDWLSRGYIAKILGYVIILVGIIIALYRFFTEKFIAFEMIVLIIVALIVGGLFLLISCFYLPKKRK